MAIDFPRAWQIVKASKVRDHHLECSYLASEGCVLCDCDVIYKHPEVFLDIMITKDGLPYNELEYIESRIGCTRY